VDVGDVGDAEGTATGSERRYNARRGRSGGACAPRQPKGGGGEGKALEGPAAVGVDHEFMIAEPRARCKNEKPRANAGSEFDGLPDCGLSG
jgi:hypothetical protein